MLADKGIDYREACRIFCNMLHSDSEVLLVAHNIQFDLLFILEMFKRCRHGSESSKSGRSTP